MISVVKLIMRVLLIEPNIHSYAIMPSLSLPAIKGYLTQHTTHNARILDLLFHKHDWQDHILTALKDKPDLIGISILSFDYDDALTIARFIKNHTQTPIIFGGVHAILTPDEIITHPEADMVCTGEGEHTLHELLDHDLNPTGITGLYYKNKDGTIIKNPPRPLTEDLDSLGIHDFTDFDIPRYFFLNHDHLPIMASRGCPYSCTYCSNHALRKTLQGRYVRFRTVDHVMNELEQRTKHYKHKGLRFLYFFDDTFILDKKFTQDFCTAYKDAGYPDWLRWTVNIRANLVTKDLMTTMKNAGCYQVRMGVETGNETLRNTVYHRDMTNTQLHTAFTTITATGLNLRLYFIVGAPQETKPQMYESLHLAQHSGADDAFFALLYPLPGTEIQTACRQAGTSSESREAALGNIPVTHTLTVTPHELNHVMRDIDHWLFTRYIKNGITLKGPRFLLDLLWFKLHLEHTYDFAPREMLPWTVEKYKLDEIYTTPDTPS